MLVCLCEFHFIRPSLWLRSSLVVGCLPSVNPLDAPCSSSPAQCILVKHIVTRCNTNCKCIIVQCTIGCITVHLMHCDRVNHIMTQSVNPLSASRSCCDPYASTPILTHLTRTKKCFLELIVSEFFLDAIASPSTYPSQ